MKYSSAGAVNLGIALAKLAAGLLGHSAAMLSEAAHSFGDTLNEVLLAIAVRRSRHPADDRHPFGYGKESFVWALLELGSINPTVVTPAAVAARGPEVVAGFVASFTLGNGHSCTKPGLLFLPAGHGLDEELRAAVADAPALPLLTPKIVDGFDDQVRDRLERMATGVAVTAAMHHGGPWPATTNPLHTSVGTTAVRRFLVPVVYQDVPQDLLPTVLRDR